MRRTSLEAGRAEVRRDFFYESALPTRASQFSAKAGDLRLLGCDLTSGTGFREFAVASIVQPGIEGIAIETELIGDIAETASLVLNEMDGIELHFSGVLTFPAYNAGSPIRYDSVSREVGFNKNTVADYITLFEQCFIVKVCPSYAKNLANELKKSKKNLLLQ